MPFAYEAKYFVYLANDISVLTCRYYQLGDIHTDNFTGSSIAEIVSAFPTCGGL